MIVIKIKGGLGNQMFEYAMARKLQLELKIDSIGMDLSFLKKDTLRDFGLNHFELFENAFVVNDNEKNMVSKLQEDIARRLESYFIAGRPEKTGSRREKKLEKFFYLLGIIQKNHSFFCFDSLLKLHKNIYMNGWFQSAEPLENMKEVLKNDFTVKGQVSENNRDLLASIKKTESVCIHIRRGDYVNHPVFGGVCTESYYEDAMKLMATKVKNPVYYVFSDSIEDVRDNIKLPFPVVYENSDDADYEGLYLMSQCKYFIMSNSTYSWWGQFLGDYEKKVVIAPGKWYREECRKSNLYMKDWIILDV